MALLSKGKLSNMMLEILLELPLGTKNLKENITFRLGLVGRMSTTRDINAAWNETKKKATKIHPEKFILDNRGSLQWNDGSIKILDQKISNSNFKKLNELAEIENCSVDTLVNRLISHYKKRNKSS